MQTPDASQRTSGNVAPSFVACFLGGLQSRSSAGLCHVAFAGDQPWKHRGGREEKKKIRKLALMKTRSSVSPSVNQPSPPSPHSLPWTWKEERGGELNLIQTSSPPRQMTALWSGSVRVWAFHPLRLSSSSSLLLFLWTEQGNLKLRRLTFGLLLGGVFAPSKGRAPYRLYTWPFMHGDRCTSQFWKAAEVTHERKNTLIHQWEI